MADSREGLCATGFMMRNSVLAEVVSEIAIAGNLKDMFLEINAANGLMFRRGTDVPSLRIEVLSLAGA